MRTTQKAALGLILGFTMAAPVPVAHAEGDAKDGNWLASRCRSPHLSRVVHQQQLQGHVRVKFDIQANGRVTNIKLVESDPPGIMDRQVMSAVRGWRYFAYLKDGVETGREGVELIFTFGGAAADSEATCTHAPWPETTTAQAK